jgi:hypothetical protein
MALIDMIASCFKPKSRSAPHGQTLFIKDNVLVRVRRSNNP